MTGTLAHGTHLKVLDESYPMNTNMTGFRWFSKNICVFVLLAKVVSALEGLWEIVKLQEQQLSVKYFQNIALE